MAMIELAAGPNCLNCQHALGEPRPRFCPACGQETNVKPPTLMEFVQQFGGAYFSTEGALWRTLKLLVLKPGELTRQYLAGRRKHYVLPLRLFLTISVMVLLAMKMQAQNATTIAVDLRGGSVAVQPPGTTPKMDLDLEFGSVRVGLNDGVFRCENLPAWVCARLKRRTVIDPKAMQEEAARFGERFVGNLGGALFLLVPAFAAWLRLAWHKRRLRYTEHLVFALHLHAFWFLALALSLGPWKWLDVIPTLAIPAYALAAMKRVYGGRWVPLLARAAVVSLAYGLTLLAVLFVLAMWSMLF